ncbi:MAG: hypothetical protein KF729_23650 [Sandaracinaceae bacterium]|nr:hypothetical protein [Sandaracinaceae bacterium]
MAVLALGLGGCGDDPAGGAEEAGVVRVDGGALDAGATPLDAAMPDAASARDAGPRVDGAGGEADAGDVPVLPGDGCDGVALRPAPVDPERRGPWSVGARTAAVGRLTVEVWYPAARASDVPVRYDLRDWLPPSQRARIPDTDNPWQDCDCTRDAPIDEARGPYPVVVFVHGTAAFRTQSLSIATHWASRGFVVAAADHPGLFLGDQLAIACPDSASGARNIAGDVDAVLAALDAPSEGLAFLAGRIDRARTALAGHSAGGAVAGLTGRPGVALVIGLASSQSATRSEQLRGALFVGAEDDRVVRYNQTVSAYASSPAPKWLLGIGGSGHLAPSDLCDLENEAGEDLVAVAQRYDVCGASFASFLFDCRPEHIEPERARVVTRAITTAILERVLSCRDRDDAIAALPGRFAEVSELRSE